MSYRGSASMQTTGNSAAFLKQPGRAIGRGDWTVRAALVSHDSDCIGLLAMAIYEQHRDDWMQNYRETFGQAPDDYACYCYELAEHTPRRLAAYRQLAEARLAQSVSPAPIGAKESFLTRLYTAERRKRRRSPGWMRQAGLSG